MSRIKVGGAKEGFNKPVKGAVLWFLGGALVGAGTMFVKNKIAARISEEDDDDDFCTDSEDFFSEYSEESSETTEE